MSATLPPAIALHVQASLRTPCLTLLTTGLETPANWLIVRLIQTALETPQHNSLNSPSTTDQDHHVVFVSIWRSLQLWVEAARRSNLDLPAVIKNKKLCYIDGLSATTASQPCMLNLQGLTLAQLNEAITRANLELTTNNSTDSTKLLLIDGLDFLLAAQTGADLTMVQSFILEMRSKFANVILSYAADSSLLHNLDAGSTPLEICHGTMLRTLAHSSQFVFQLRPLDTGHSKDVTGSLRISHGGAYEAVPEAVNEGEWLYQVNADGTVKIWQRGA